MKFRVGIVAAAIVFSSLSVSAFADEAAIDPAFTRIMEIDGELNKLISERDTLIAQKMDTASEYVHYETMYTPGQYKVGSEIPAGEYVFFATGEYSGSFKETTDSNGSDRVGSEYFSYNMIYTLTEGNYVEIEDAVAVPFADVKELSTKKGSGTFKVGVHIPAGEYRLIPTGAVSNGSCQIYANSFLGDYHNQIDSEYFSSATYVNVHDGEYLILNDCLFVE